MRMVFLGLNNNDQFTYSCLAYSVITRQKTEFYYAIRNNQKEKNNNN